jgi:hypothetical protein
MEPALPLDYVEFDPHVEHTGDISDMSAEQYLSWVRSQASNLPSGENFTNYSGSKFIYDSKF